MSKVNEWESAWAEYINALDNYDADWSGENFNFDIGRAGSRLRDAKNELRAIDALFCTALGI